MTERRRRRSRDVALVALPALALAFSACGGDEETAYCVDENDQVVENQYCDDEANDRDGVGAGVFFWYYGGSVVGGRVARGARLKGGDRVAASNVAENVRRGGFGSRSKSSAGGFGRSTASSGGG